MKNPIEDIADKNTHYDNGCVVDCAPAPCLYCRGIGGFGGDVCPECEGSGLHFKANNEQS